MPICPLYNDTILISVPINTRGPKRRRRSPPSRQPTIIHTICWCVCHECWAQNVNNIAIPFPYTFLNSERIPTVCPALCSKIKWCERNFMPNHAWKMMKMPPRPGKPHRVSTFHARLKYICVPHFICLCFSKEIYSRKKI